MNYLEHPIVRRDADNWRAVPLDKRQTYSCKGGLPDVHPLATNGILFICMNGEREFVGHVTNLIKPDAVFHGRSSTPKAPSVKQPRKTKTRIGLIDITELL